MVGIPRGQVGAAVVRDPSLPGDSQDVVITEEPLQVPAGSGVDAGEPGEGFRLQGGLPGAIGVLIEFAAAGAGVVGIIAARGMGGGHGLSLHHQVGQSRDDLRLRRGGLGALIILVAVAANSASVILGVARLAAGRRLGIMQDHGVAQCVHRLLLYRGLPLPRRIQEGLFAGGAEVVCMVAQGRAGSRRLLMLFHRVPQCGQSLRLHRGQLGPLRILGGLLADRAVVVVMVAVLCAGGGLFRNQA